MVTIFRHLLRWLTRRMHPNIALATFWITTSLLIADAPAVTNAAETDGKTSGEGAIRNGGTEKSADGQWRIASRCGVNAVYVLLRLLEQDVSYEEVVEALPVHESGVSLADMKVFVRHKGIPAEVVRVTPDRLRKCPLPAIALLERDMQEGGHFIVILASSPDDVKIVDGTTGAVESTPYAEFLRQWHGYLLIRGSPSNWMKRLFAVSIAIGLACLVFLVWAHMLQPFFSVPRRAVRASVGNVLPPISLSRYSTIHDVAPGQTAREGDKR